MLLLMSHTGASSLQARKDTGIFGLTIDLMRACGELAQASGLWFSELKFHLKVTASSL